MYGVCHIYVKHSVNVNDIIVTIFIKEKTFLSHSPKGKKVGKEHALPRSPALTYSSIGKERDSCERKSRICTAQPSQPFLQPPVPFEMCFPEDAHLSCHPRSSLLGCSGGCKGASSEPACSARVCLAKLRSGQTREEAHVLGGPSPRFPTLLQLRWS